MARIVHLIDSGGFFGAEQLIVTLASEQIRRGDEPWITTIVSPKDESNPLGDAARAAGICTHDIDMEDGLRPQCVHDVMQWCRSINADIVHCHGYKANILMALGSARRRTWVLITTLHGWTAKTMWSKLWLNEAFERLLLQAFDGICIVGSHMFRRLPFYVRGSGKVSVIPNGIAIDRTTALLPEDIAEFTAMRKAIVFVGRLSFEKDVGMLLRAFNILVSSDPEVCLVIVGNGPQRLELRELVMALGLGDSVFFAGYRESPGRWLSHFSVFALSSTTEGLPLVILEAMAAGLPIVATNVGAIPDVVNHTDARLCEPRDFTAMAAALGAALSTPDTPYRRAVRRQHVQAQYSSEAMANGYAAVYRAGLPGSARPAG